MTLFATVAAALVGAMLFERLGVPAGSLIGAMVAVMLVNVSPVPVSELPGPAQFLSFVALGWLIGQEISLGVLRSLLANTPLIATAAVLLVVFGGVLAFVCVQLGLLDPATAFLATSPGGLSQMAALSAAVGADAAVVVTLHIVRVVVVILIAPLGLRLLSGSG